MVESQIFKNPRQWDEMSPSQERAVQITIIEVLIYMSVICSFAIYTFIRMLNRKKLMYPRAFVHPNRSDFLLRALGRLEMFITVSSPGFAAFALNVPLLDGFGLILIIQIVVAIQAMLPFL